MEITYIHPQPHRPPLHNMSEYGSIPADADHSFEEYDVNYIQSKALTTKERWTKLLRASLPIVVALVLLGGFGWWTSQAVAPHRSNDKVITVEYKDPSTGVMPSSSSSSSSSVIGSTPMVVVPKTNQVDMKPMSSSSASSSSTTHSGRDTSLCSTNSKCSSLGLIGSCCPTNEGVVLGCCD